MVGLGGALGAMARYGVSLAAARLWGLAFPWGTLAANVLGGLAIGVLAAKLAPAQEPARLLIGVGVLGGFTTFSTFSLETIALFERGEARTALFYVAASLALSLLACWAGLAAGRAL